MSVKTCACEAGYFAPANDEDKDSQLAFERKDGEMWMVARDLRQGAGLLEVWFRGVRFCPLCGREF